MAGAFQRLDTPDGIARLYFDVPGQKVNVFNAAVFEELEQVLGELEEHPPRALLIFSRKKDIFIAGADIHEFLKIETFTDGVKASRRGQLIFERLHRLPFPTIAVIDGACMGGGTEMSLACTYRLASQNSQTKIALPEVKLGILPGWGGTQRLPKLVGLERALDVMLTGKNLNAQKALRLGLVDALVAPDRVEDQALRFARQVLDGRANVRQRGLKRSGLVMRWLEKTALGRKIIFNTARKNILRKTFGNYPAPLKMLEVVEKTYALPLDEGLKIEADALAELILTKESRNLVRVFLLQDTLKKKTQSIAEQASTVLPSEIHILAGDDQALDVVRLLLKSGFSVVVLNEDPIRLQNLEKKFLGYFEKLVTQDRSRNEIGSVSFTALSKLNEPLRWLIMDDPSLASDELEWVVAHPPQRILVSSRTFLSRQYLQKSQWENWHALQFYVPIERSMVAEVGVDARNEAAVPEIFQLLRALKKIPIRNYAQSKLLFGTMLLPYLLEAVRLADEGVKVKTIDNIMKKFGMVSGPFSFIDALGTGVVLSAARADLSLAKEYANELKILEKMYDVGWQGVKAGKGFYVYGEKKVKYNYGAEVLWHRTAVPEDIQSRAEGRLVAMMLNGAAQAMAEKQVSAPEELDAVAVFAFGFAPFRGGILRYADTLGAGSVRQMLDALKDSCGQRFTPHALWQKMAESEEKFYAQEG